MFRPFGGALAALLTISAAAAGSSEGPQFDQGVRVPWMLETVRERASAAPAADGALWVSFGRSDLGDPRAAGFPLTAPVLASDRAAVFRLEPERLPELSHFMHERFGRCGGFFAHQTRQEAEMDLTPPVVAAGGPYTIDQEAWTRPLMARVREAELRGTIETMAAYQNRYYQAETGVAAARWLGLRWQALASALPGASLRLVTHTGWKQPSVVLSIPGSATPDEVVILGGHLDSIAGWGGERARAPGADDNASGIAVLTEALRVLGEAGFRPRRTVEFMGYAAEEVGLRGSKELASSYAAQGKKVVGVIQYDMTNFKGSADAIYLLTDNVDGGLTAFLGKLIETYVGAPWSSTKCGYACSDHASWTRSGFRASAAFESAFDGMNQALHTERDTLATSGGSAAHSVSFAKLAVAFASELGKTTPGATSAKAAR